MFISLWYNTTFKAHNKGQAGQCSSDCIMERSHVETLFNEDVRVLTQQMGTGAKVVHF